jgi:hypothetical protein
MSELAEVPYIRCRTCSFVAQPGSMEYLTTPDRVIDWSGTVRASCGICGREHVITRADTVPALDAEHTCPRPGCGAVTACPASAARVRCCKCGLYGIGPGAATDETRAELDIQERLHGWELRQAVLQARRRARGAGEG